MSTNAVIDCNVEVEKCYRGSGWCSDVKRLALYLRSGFCCAYCGDDLKDRDPREMGLDHLVCHTHGGTNDVANLVMACRSCNSKRGTKPWKEYATGGAVERIKRLVKKPVNMKLARAILNGETEWADR